MFYHLYQFLKDWDVPGLGMFQYISFRSGAAIIVSLLITIGFGKKLINFLRLKQIGEDVRDLGLEGQMQKKGTPTMGGIIILASILIPTILFARLDNIYIILMLITTVWLGLIGFADDYIKVFLKDKKGLAGKFKILGQVSLGIIVAATLYFSDDVVVRQRVVDANGMFVKEMVTDSVTGQKRLQHVTTAVKSTRTTIPFMKNHELSYGTFVAFMGKNARNWAWIVYALAIILIITAVSNAANLTDGIDGLATGTSAISGATLGILAYVSGNVIYADYLNIMYIPNLGELTVFIAAFIGATVGFLWYNSYPAQVFMGDTGSLALGGALGAIAVAAHHEIVLAIVGGLFVLEAASVIIQVFFYKRTGRRVFRMAPIHHHFEQLGWAEATVVIRFWIVSIILALIGLATLKLR